MIHAGIRFDDNGAWDAAREELPAIGEVRHPPEGVAGDGPIQE